MANQVISFDEIRKAPRGRQPIRDESLLATLKGLKPGQAVVLSDYGDVSDNYQTMRSRVTSHWKMAFGDGAVSPVIVKNPETGELQVGYPPAAKK